MLSDTTATQQVDVAMYTHLMSNARKKVMTGMELHMADATVAEVYLRLPLYRLMLSVFLQTVCNHFSSLLNEMKNKKKRSCTALLI